MIKKINFLSFKSGDILRDKERNIKEGPSNYYIFKRYFLILLCKRVTKQKRALMQEKNKFILHIYNRSYEI